MNALLVGSREIAPEVRHFLFEIPSVEKLEFTAGQFVSFTQEVHGRSVTRAYSLAAFSPWIFQLKPGDTIQMRGPLGYFVPRQPFRDSLFIATGTGIAPFRAFLGAEPVRSHAGRITLLFGARYADGLLYRAEFDQFHTNRPGFRFLPTITQPAAAWAGRSHRNGSSATMRPAAAIAGRASAGAWWWWPRAPSARIRSCGRY